ncbi:hypothetical protein ZIOFF_017304 [Zingiber officinale]|uniref:Single-stranded DNA binding protein Ssb-like OB fold domain-containing protein n=1 Tax=Zingiber officinale TaxID=94328 RepID=A0A8J5HRZ8_ZINOF|nr:hypothetical protein ZIOFF_017304 [Zingiber officinale]
MSESKPAMGKPEFTPRLISLGLVRQMRLARCLVGDETGMTVFTARNEQGTAVVLRNAIDMFKGSMWLALDKWGRIETTDSADSTVKEGNHISLIEFELVTVVDE